MAKNDEPFGKTGEAIQLWFRTFMMLLRRRRALLLSADEDADKPMSPIAFMLSGTVAAYGVMNLASPKAPVLELPDSVSLLKQLIGMLGDLTSLYITAITMVSAGGAWMCFRAFRVPLSWKAAIRQTAYFTGAQAPTSMPLATLPLAFQGKLGPLGYYFGSAAFLIYLLSYLALLYWLLLQYAAEAGVRVRRTLLPFSIALTLALALTVWIADAQPDEWVPGWMSSMMAPAVQPSDHLHVDRWAIYGRTLKPGEVVVLLPAKGFGQWFPFGGALQTAMMPIAARVIAVPGDHVAARGSDLLVNGQILARGPMQRPPGSADDIMTFQQHIGARDVVVTYNVGQHPKQCVGEAERVLTPDTYLLAYDKRLDAAFYCNIFQRTRIGGLIDWNDRTKAPP